MRIDREDEEDSCDGCLRWIEQWNNQMNGNNRIRTSSSDRKQRKKIAITCGFFMILNILIFLIMIPLLINVRYSWFFEFLKKDWSDFRGAHLSSLERAQDQLQMISYNSSWKDEVLFRREEILESWRSKYHLFQSRKQEKPNDQRKWITVALISVGRQYPYLVSSVASILDALDEEERSSCFFFVFNANRPAQNNTAAMTVKPVFPVLDVNDIPSKILNDLPKINSTYQKEAIDYVMILRLCYALGTKYALLLEDDVIASPHFISKILKRAIPNVEPGGEFANVKWMNMRLFVSDFWEHWGMDNSWIWISMFVGLGLIATNIHLVFTEGRLFTGCAKRLDHWFIFALWMFTFAWTIRFIGKQNLVPSSPNGLTEWDGTGGNTAVALLYPSQIIPDVTEYLETNYKTNPKDVVIDQLARTKHIMQLHLVPHLFQHNGAFSSQTDKWQGDFIKFKVTTQFDESEIVD